MHRAAARCPPDTITREDCSITRKCTITQGAACGCPTHAGHGEMVQCNEHRRCTGLHCSAGLLWYGGDKGDGWWEKRKKSTRACALGRASAAVRASETLRESWRRLNVSLSCNNSSLRFRQACGRTRGHILRSARRLADAEAPSRRSRYRAPSHL